MFNHAKNVHHVSLPSLLKNLGLGNTTVLAISYLKEAGSDFLDWVDILGKLATMEIEKSIQFHIDILWIPANSFIPKVQDMCLAMSREQLTNTWTISYSLYNSTDYEDEIEANGYIIYMEDTVQPCVYVNENTTNENHSFLSGYGNCLSNNTKQFELHMNLHLSLDKLILVNDNYAISLQFYAQRLCHLSRTFLL